MKMNPQAMYEQMLKTNPRFARFVQENRNKTPEEIARRYGVDINLLQQFINIKK